MRQGDFRARQVGTLFERFSLGPPFEEFQKMADFGVFAKFALERKYGRIFVLGHNLFLEAHSFPRALSDNCSPFGTDVCKTNIQHIFAHMEAIVYIFLGIFNVKFRN